MVYQISEYTEWTFADKIYDSLSLTDTRRQQLRSKSFLFQISKRTIVLDFFGLYSCDLFLNGLVSMPKHRVLGIS